MAKGELNVAYETKVLLIAISEIVCRAKNLREVHRAVEKMANAEGIVLESYEKQKENLEHEQE